MTLPASLQLSCAGLAGLLCPARGRGGQRGRGRSGATGGMADGFSALLVGRDPHLAMGPTPALSTKGCHGLTLPLTAAESF